MKKERSGMLFESTEIFKLNAAIGFMWFYCQLGSRDRSGNAPPSKNSLKETKQCFITRQQFS